MQLKPVCTLTHGLIKLGTCPWCEQPIADGQLKPDLPPRAVAIRQWNIPAMLQALEHEDVEVSSNVPSSIVCYPPKAEDAMPVLRVALQHKVRQVRWLAMQALCRLGMDLHCEDAQRLEQASRGHPDDLALHVLLLNYYFFLPASTLESPRGARHKHVLWLIEKVPGLTGLSHLDLDPKEDSTVYDEAKRLWLEHVTKEETNLAVLGNAAQFFISHDKELCASLLKKAQRLEPNNPEWSKRLGYLYGMGLNELVGEARRQAAALSFAELEKAYIDEKEELKRFLMLPELAQAALQAGEQQKARDYATDLLQQSEKPGYFYHKEGDAVFHGNLVLGKLCLLAGDVAKAKEHLLAAGMTSGSPVLCSGGPDMALAQELLDRGEKEVVIEFLRRCANFWETNDHKAEQWIYAIEQGQKPDFSHHL
jgi:hypothetical protein